MLYLIGVILTNVALYPIFKLFQKYGIDSLQAIVFNYCTCFTVGSLLLGHIPVGGSTLQQPWLPLVILTGCMFISLFNLISWCTRQNGITTTTIANKLSLIIPAIASVFLYDEKMGIGEIAGIVVAFPAVYLATRQPKDDAIRGNIFWPILLFVGSGLLDTLLKYTQHHYLDTTETQLGYTVHIFFIAAVLGIITVAVKERSGFRLRWKNLLAGVALGIPNFFSVYLLIRLLHSNVLQSSAAIPVNNISIVLLSGLIAIFFFKEKATPARITGLVLAIISILLITLSDMNG